MINFGDCMICGKDVAPACSQCGARKPGSQYTEVEMNWSNGAKMQVGICVDCAVANKHTTAQAKQQITKAHHDHWTEQSGRYDPSIILV